MGDHFYGPSEAARRLGVTAKALRVYEERGLLTPSRSTAGWRAYGRSEMARAAEIIKLRDLGLSLEQIARVMKGDSGDLEAALRVGDDGLVGPLRGHLRPAHARDVVPDVHPGLTPGQFHRLAGDSCTGIRGASRLSG